MEFVGEAILPVAREVFPRTVFLVSSVGQTVGYILAMVYLAFLRAENAEVALRTWWLTARVALTAAA